MVPVATCTIAVGCSTSLSRPSPAKVEDRPTPSGSSNANRANSTYKEWTALQLPARVDPNTLRPTILAGHLVLTITRPDGEHKVAVEGIAIRKDQLPKAKAVIERAMRYSWLLSWVTPIAGESGMLEVRVVYHTGLASKDLRSEVDMELSGGN